MSELVQVGLSLKTLSPEGYWVGLSIVFDINGDGREDVILGYTSTNPAAHAFPLRVLLSTGEGFRDGTQEVLGGNIFVDGPGAYVLADLNRDGRDDLFIANSGLDILPFPGAASTLILSGTAGLRAASLPPHQDFAHSVAHGDIDGDGDLDIYVGNIAALGAPQPVGPLFLINNGSGSFTEDRTRLPANVTNIRTSHEAYTGSAMADVDGDNDVDLIIGGLSDGSVSRVLVNDGTGRFTAGRELPRSGTNPSSEPDPVTHILTTDLNGDGRVDLIVNYAIENYRDRYLQVLISNGDGTFADETAQRILTLPEVAEPEWRYRWLAQPELRDVNGDGHKDIVIGAGTMTSVMLNDGHGRFVTLPDTLAKQNPHQTLVSGDFNGDGIGDYMVWHANLGDREVMTISYGQRPKGIQTGDAGANGMIGTTGNDNLDGLGGDDVFVTFAGNDRIDGGDGNDRSHGGLGNDTLDGGAGLDYLRGEEGDDMLLGGGAFDDMHGNMGNDTLRGGDGDDWVVGGKDNDVLSGDDGFDIVYGNLGNDTVEGGAGDDWVRGGQADDILSGGAGNDLIWGDRGSDTLSGGVGSDTFYVHDQAGTDRVLDFNGSEGDRIKIEFGAYAVVVVGTDTVLDFGGGNQMVLVGVSNFDVGWVI